MTEPGALELRGAWGVDTFEGRSGTLDITVLDGVMTSVAWSEIGGDPDGRLVVVPALIDLDAALDTGPDDGDGETAETLALAAAHGGYATVQVRGLGDTPAPAELPVRLLPAAERLPSAPPTGAVLVSLLRAAADGRSLTVAADDTAMTAGTEAGEGLVATILGLRPAPDESEIGAVRRALDALTEAIRLERPGVAPRLHLARVSLAASIELIRGARARGLPVTADAAAAHLALHDGWIGSDRRFAWAAAAEPWRGPVGTGAYHPSTRMRPPLRTPADALAVARGVDDGTIDAVVSAHEPFRSWQTNVEFGDAPAGMSGIETAASLLFAAVAAGALGLEAAVRSLTAGPAAVLGEQHRGFIEGRTAYLTIVDMAGTWRPADSLRSRGRNTPLLESTLRGRVLATIVGGRVAYADAGARKRLRLVGSPG